MKKQFSIALLGLVAALSACDDMLVEQPKDTITTSTFYRTVEDLERGMLAGYGPLHTVFPGAHSAWWGALGNMSDAERIHGAATNQTRNVSALDWTAANMQQLDIGWENLYQLIYRENIVLARADEVSGGPEAKSEIIAEAKFLRAYAYMWLDRMHSAGEPPTYAGTLSSLSVPLLLSEEDQRAASDVARATVEEVHAAIIKDLTAAEADLPTASARGTAGRGQATKGAARMALADLYLWRSTFLQTNEWNAVVEWTQKVIDSGEYELVQSGWFDIWNPGAKLANTENIFFMVAVGAPGRQNSQFIHLHGPRQLGFSTGGGYGTNMVTEWQLGLYAEGDIRGGVGPVPVLGTRQSDTVAYRNYGCSTGVVAGFTDEGGKCGPVDIYPYKFRATSLQAGEGDVDIPFYRYAETLLMQAEALNEIGNTAGAAARLNEIRARARLGATGTDDRREPADISSTLSPEQMRDSIYIDRARELSHENKRWIDMVRRDSGDPGYWSAAVASDFQHMTIVPNTPEQLFKKRLPIPQREIDLNPNLAQNPGY